ncbi:hypothetical protein Pan97_28680 [Bremerella volcania]|uniref:Uncharacterized protein n=1 Tax=Bremerella volcania TaxID=2527984 RepID=A0A518C9B7_9BACT|nr:hypothetical protein Pan97_28680 [Bremerella volcania]
MREETFLVTPDYSRRVRLAHVETDPGSEFTVLRDGVAF